MTRHNNLSSLLSDMAEAMRNKFGLTGQFKADDFDTTIANLPEYNGEILPDYLCFTAEEADSTISLGIDTQYGPVTVFPTLEYSKDLITWLPFTVSSTVVTLALGERMFMRGNNPYISPPGSDVGSIKFNLTGKIGVSGNIMSLLDKTCQLMSVSSSACFYALFKNCVALTSAPKLPATTLGEGVYGEMFMGCTNLTVSPKLPATANVGGCYMAMFYGCTSLNSIPLIHLNTLPAYCCYNMFAACPEIRISTAKDSTYKNAYRIPAEGTVTDGGSALLNMFSNTGGTFTGTPQINTTYYTSNEVI